MKKIFVLMIACMSAITSFAQTEVGAISIKPEVGINNSNVLVSSSFKNGRDTKTAFGLVLGAEGAYQVSDKLALSLGARYSQQGYKIDGGTYTNDIDLDYINIPVLVNYYITPVLAIKAGVQPGFCINAKEENRDYGEYIKKFDLGIPVGVSYEVSNIVFDLRYTIGVTDFCKYSVWDTTFNNSVISFTIGYKINL